LGKVYAKDTDPEAMTGKNMLVQ